MQQNGPFPRDYTAHDWMADFYSQACRQPDRITRGKFGTQLLPLADAPGIRLRLRGREADWAPGTLKDLLEQSTSLTSVPTQPGRRGHGHIQAYLTPARGWHKAAPDNTPLLARDPLVSFVTYMEGEPVIDLVHRLQAEIRQAQPALSLGQANRCARTMFLQSLLATDWATLTDAFRGPATVLRDGYAVDMVGRNTLFSLVPNAASPSGFCLSLRQVDHGLPTGSLSRYDRVDIVESAHGGKLLEQIRTACMHGFEMHDPTFAAMAQEACDKLTHCMQQAGYPCDEAAVDAICAGPAYSDEAPTPSSPDRIFRLNAPNSANALHRFFTTRLAEEAPGFAGRGA